jgi:hypothetical protein
MVAHCQVHCRQRCCTVARSQRPAAACQHGSIAVQPARCIPLCQVPSATSGWKSGHRTTIAMTTKPVATKPMAGNDLVKGACNNSIHMLTFRSCLLSQNNMYTWTREWSSRALPEGAWPHLLCLDRHPAS